MAKHKRNRKFTVTRQRATLRAEKEQGAMSKCMHCGGYGGHHAEGCPAVIARAKADAAAASQKQRGDALMHQLEGTLMGKLRQVEAERDALTVTLAGVQEQASIYRDRGDKYARLLFAGAARAERMDSALTRQRSEIDLLREELFVARGMQIVKRLLAEEPPAAAEQGG